MSDWDRLHPDMLQPRDEADVAEIIATTDCPLEPLAGGSKRAVGRPVTGEVLDLGALRGILSYEPDELIITARAATPLDEIEAALRAEGQRLAFEPPDWTALLAAPAMPGATTATADAPLSAVRPTIGGVLAANASGSRRLTAGAARDHFLGFRAVSGRAERFKAGGRVVKNVTGYDLPKLLAGSWGTLAVLTEVTVRVHPLPECERTLLLALAAPSAAVGALGAALASACEVSAAAFSPRFGAALRLEG
ncbi:MAG: FAD-binding protein, partial [Steroidobacteraceae bacterium]